MTDEQDSGNNEHETPPETPEVKSVESVPSSESKPATEADLQEVEKQMNGFERSTLRWTRASFVIVLATAIFIGLQWLEMRSGGQDTHDLAVAAKTQAEKMKDMSDAADKIRQAAEGMVDQERRIADNAKKSLEASNRQSKAALDATIAQNRLDQRAWVGIQGDQVIQFESGKPPKIQILFFNSGKTPATKTHESSGYLLSPNPISGPPPEIIKELNEELPMNPRQSIPPQGRYLDTLGDIPPSGALGQTLMEKHHFGLANIMANYDRILRGDVIFYVFGEIQYLDGSGRSHTTEYCMFLSNPEKKELQFCEGFNDLT